MVEECVHDDPRACLTLRSDAFVRMRDYCPRAHHCDRSCVVNYCTAMCGSRSITISVWVVACFKRAVVPSFAHIYTSVSPSGKVPGEISCWIMCGRLPTEHAWHFGKWSRLSEHQTFKKSSTLPEEIILMTSLSWLPPKFHMCTCVISETGEVLMSWGFNSWRFVDECYRRGQHVDGIAVKPIGVGILVLFTFMYPCNNVCTNHYTHTQTLLQETFSDVLDKHLLASSWMENTCSSIDGCRLQVHAFCLTLNLQQCGLLI